MKRLSAVFRWGLGLTTALLAFLILALWLASLLYDPGASGTSVPLFKGNPVLAPLHLEITASGMATRLALILLGALTGAVSAGVLAGRYLNRAGWLGTTAKTVVVGLVGLTLWLSVDRKDEQVSREFREQQGRDLSRLDQDFILQGYAGRPEKERPFGGLPTYTLRTLSPEELPAHEAEVMGAWQAYGEARLWMAGIAAMPRFDDLTLTAASRHIDLGTVRDVSINQLHHARLACLKGDAEAALADYQLLLAFSTNVQTGSHSLAHTMMGGIVEKLTLKDLASLVRFLPESKHEELRKLCETPSTPSVQEAMRRDILTLLEAVDRADLAMSGTWRPFLKLVWHPEETKALAYHLYLKRATATDEPGVTSPKSLPRSLRFRNLLGEIYARSMAEVDAQKLRTQAEQITSLRREILEKLNAPARQNEGDSQASGSSKACSFPSTS